MNITYDAQVDAAYIKFNNAPAAKTVRIIDNILIDFSISGKIVGIELLGIGKINTSPSDHNTKRLSKRFIAS